MIPARNSRLQHVQSISKSASRSLLLAAAAGLLYSQAALATSDTWMGTTNGVWATATNWSTNSTAPGAGETATFSLSAASVNNNTTIDLGAGGTIGSVIFDSSNAAAYTIGAGTVGSQILTLNTLGNAIILNSTVANNQLFNAKLALSTTATAGTFYTFSNDSLTNSVTYAGGISASTAGIKVLNIAGAGNTTISGAITAGSGSMNLLKTGTGTLVLSGGGAFNGNLTQGNIPANSLFPVVLREGTTQITAGTYAVTGEFVMGGVVANGGAGTNNRLQVDGGTLAISSYLSIGRGNGTGGVSNDLVVNNSGVVTAANISAGYNGGNAANTPKGSITLNNSARLADTGILNLAESPGSNYTLTMNDTASLTVGGELRVAGTSGVATFTMNGTSTASVGTLRVGIGDNATQTAAGTVILNSGTTFRSEGDVLMGFAGNANLGNIIINGATMNVASTTERWMILDQWDTSRGQLDMNSGTLNLNANTDMRFFIGNTATSGAGTVNQNGGAVTFYSDNATTISGTGGVIDMARSGSATAVSTYNLNGGTLTVGQVLSTTALPTRTFNLNGGVLRPTGSSTNWINLGTGNTSLNVLAGGAKIDTRGMAVTIVSPLLGSAGDGGLTKSGAGTLTLAGANNTYNGLTHISNGQLVVTGSLSATSGVQIDAGASFNPRGNITLPSAITSSGTIDLTDAAAGTLGTTALNLTNGTLNFEFAGGVNDRINVTNGAAITNSKINLSIASGALNAGTYTLMTATGGLNSGLSLGSLPPGFFSFNLASSTPTAAILSVTGNPTPAVAYWTGLGSAGSGTVEAAANNWGAGSAINKSNWSTTADGLTDPLQVPGPGTDVTLTASNAVGSAGALTTKLDGSYSIKTLSFDVPASTGITSAAITTTGQTLTIGSGGLVQAATSNAAGSITGTGTVVLNGSQTWANNSALAMTVNAPVNTAAGTTVLTVGGSGSGNVTIAGGITDGGGNVSLLVNRAAGTTVVAGTSTYSGTTTIMAGTLNATGTITSPGALSVGGEGGTGVMNVNTGAAVTINNLAHIGYRTGTGTMNIAGGTLTVNNDFRVGSSDVNGATYNAAGTVVMTSGVATLSSMTVARGNAADNAVSGTVNLSGGVINSANDVILGYAGSGLGKLSISGGSFNVATTATRWMMLGFWDSTSGQLDISNGSLNLNYGSSLVLGRQATVGTAVVNQTGGSISSFSDYATTVGGNGGLDMQYVGSATFSSSYNLDGGTLSIFRIFSTTATGTRVFNFNGGTLRPVVSDTAFMNLGAGSATANVRNGGAKIDTNGFNVTIASPLVHSTIGGDNAIDGGLTKNGLGALTLTGNSTYTGPTTVNGGTLVLNKTHAGTGAISVASGAALSLNSSVATGSLAASAMTLDSSILSFNLGAITPTDPLYNLSGALTRNGNNVINVSGSLTSGTITLIKYAGGESGAGSFSMGTMPNRTTGTLFDLGGGKVDLFIAVTAIKWSGLGDGQWVNAVQTPTKNWKDPVNPIDYTQGDPVIFDDSATGTLTVNIPADVSPAGVTVNNPTKDYTFAGTGKITGAAALVKSGAGKLTIANTLGNDYTGGTVISAGTVEIAGTSDTTANLNFLGTGAIVNNSVILVNRPSGGANPHYDYTLLRPSISGTGSLIIQSNTANDGNDSFDGTVTVKSGALYFLDSPTAMGSAVGGTTVESGAGLQVYNASRDYGLEPITMSGDGPTYDGGLTNEGAIYVNGGITATMGGTMTLAGDTSVRPNGTLVWNGALAGSTYTLTKTGTGRLIIGGNATYGTSVVRAGALQIGNGGTLGNLGSGQVTLDNGTLDIVHSDTYTVSNYVTNVGAIANSGTGTAIFSNASSDFFGSIVANNGTLILQGAGYPSTLTVNTNGVLRVANDLYGGLAPVVAVNSNNAQTGALELSGGVASPFSAGTITLSGRNNTSSGIRSINGLNTLNSNIDLAAGGNQYRVEAAAGGTFSVSGNITGIAGLAAGERVVTFAGAGVGTMSGVISTGGASTLSIAKVGSGTWTMEGAHSYNGNTTVNGGTLVLKIAAQTPVSSGAGANVQNGYLVMEHGADSGVMAADVENVLTTGHGLGTPFSSGKYRSSTADATKGLGWKDDGTNTTIGYAYYGDADLSGTVDSLDFNALVGNYGKLSGATWAGGDFDYNDKVNTLDFNFLAGNFGLTIATPVAAPLASGPSLGAVVPEPTTISLLALGAGMMLRRRNRKM